MPIAGEVWKDVVGFEGKYQVSNKGRVQSKARVVVRKNGRPCNVRGRILRPHYARGSLHFWWEGKGVYVHRLVLEAFVGPCPAGMECRHFPDSNTSNNTLENLSWGTPKENSDDKKVHGTFGRGGILPGELNGMYGKTHTQEALNKMRGRRLSPEHRASLREAWKRRKARVSANRNGPSAGWARRPIYYGGE